MEGVILSKLVATLFDVFGASAVRAACDDECKIREARAEAVARRNGEPPDTLPDRPPEEL